MRNEKKFLNSNSHFEILRRDLKKNRFSNFKIARVKIDDERKILNFL